MSPCLCAKTKLHYVIIPLIVFLVAFIGGLITDKGMGWYGTIHLPSWTPGGSVIGAAWTIIFILAAISALLVWNKAPRDSRFKRIVDIFLANAALNIFWSYLFFGRHFIGASIAEMLVLGISTIALIILIWPVSKLASVLLVPYAGWVLFATYLAYNVLLLN